MFQKVAAAADSKNTSIQLLFGAERPPVITGSKSTKEERYML